MPVDFYIYPAADTAANRDGWRRSIDMLSTFEDLFGPYPFRDEKYAIYQFQFGGGMEHQTATGQGGNNAFSDRLTSHELAHQWWGDMLTCATWHDVWLNEGFATYSTASSRRSTAPCCRAATGWPAVMRWSSSACWA
jgi:aminopeptidase N